MSDKLQNQPPKPHDGGLASVQNDTAVGQFVPIINPHNILEESLIRMPPEKQAEVLSKAADEALRIIVKSKENELDIKIVSDKIEQASRVGRFITQNPGVTVGYETEHQSKHGDTRIKVTSKSGCASVLVMGIGILAGIAWLV